jgi:hypothetical protein
VEDSGDAGTTPQPAPAASPGSRTAGGAVGGGGGDAPVSAATRPPASGPAPRRRRRRRGAAKDAAGKKEKTKLGPVAATTAVTAVITAVVGGVLSQDRIDSVLGDDPSSASPTTTVAYHHVAEYNGVIALDVPESWGSVDAAFSGIAGIADGTPGLGLRAGPDPMATRFVSNETVWVGASTQSFDDLGLDSLDDDAVADLFAGRLESSVYLPRNDCTPAGEHAPELGDDWVGAVRAWQDCSSVDGWRAVEVEMVSADRDVYVYLQIGLAPGTPDEVSQRMLDSLTVLPSKLPS